ncbi:MAG: sodium:proton antiporter [Candidatus Binatia bacterium]
MDFLHVLPFAGMLLGIAVVPLLFPHQWERPATPALLTAACALPTLVFAVATGRTVEILHGIEEYVAFIVLIAALYITTGGIHVAGNLRATPLINASYLGVGAIAASLIGTTGASMLLIRPLLHTNRERQHKTHIVVFFILVVSNTGGLLTPLGDPPLYLGYIKGVPFSFTFQLWPAWLLAQAMLLAMFLLWDSRAYARESRADIERDRRFQRRLQFDGLVNIPIALAIIAISAAGVPSPWREGLFALLIVLSLKITPKRAREANGFHTGPLLEVAVLFLGIFITMVPALAALRVAAPSLPVDTTSGLFLMTGVLSSLLDNAPTYLIFAELAAERAGFAGDLRALASQAPALLAAVSIGAVFMGANTYIGNGPNLLVKAVAEQAGSARVAMPSFFAYAAIATITLTPVYIGVLWLILD